MLLARCGQSLQFPGRHRLAQRLERRRRTAREGNRQLARFLPRVRAARACPHEVPPDGLQVGVVFGQGAGEDLQHLLLERAGAGKVAELPEGECEV